MPSEPVATLLVCEAIHHHRDGSVSLLGINWSEISPGQRLLEIGVGLNLPWADPDSEGYELSLRLELWRLEEFEQAERGPQQTSQSSGSVPPAPDGRPLPFANSFTETAMMADLEPDTAYVVALRINERLAATRGFVTGSSDNDGG